MIYSKTDNEHWFVWALQNNLDKLEDERVFSQDWNVERCQKHKSAYVQGNS